MSNPPSWLDGLSPRTRATVESTGEALEFEPDTTLVFRGAQESHLFVIEHGTALVIKDGRPDVAVGPGELLGEMAFLENAPRRNTIAAATRVRARRISRPQLLGAFLADPQGLREVLDSLGRLKESRLATVQADNASAALFVESLTAEALRHRAVRHPYLEALHSGALPDTRWALEDHARHAGDLALLLPSHLAAVCARLEEDAHRLRLVPCLSGDADTISPEERLALERAGVKGAWVEGFTRKQLLTRFARAVQLDLARLQARDQVEGWRQMFFHTLVLGAPAEAVGALALGGEALTQATFGSMLQALYRTDVDLEAGAYFAVQALVKPAAAEPLLDIAAGLARTGEGRLGLRRGMLKALTLRAARWDWLYARATDPGNAEMVH